MYPDNFQTAVNGPLLKVASSDLMSLNGTEEYHDEAFGQHRKFTFDIILSSTANILGLLRFELRVLRFFNDMCVPFLTYNVNKRHSIVWEVVVPQYVTSSPSIRLAILAMGCLNIMPILGMERLIQENMDPAEVAKTLEASSDTFEVQRLFADDYMMDQGDDINLFRHASEFFTHAVSGTHEAVQQLLDPNLSRQKRAESLSNATITSYLMYSFIGLHPWKMLPLVHFPEPGEEPKPDMLSIAAGMKTLIVGNLDELRASDIGELFFMDELQFVFRQKVKLVEDISNQLNEHLQKYSFLQIDLTVSSFIGDMKEALLLFDKACSISVKFNYPVFLYKWLPMVGPQLIPHVRAKEPFAMHFLYVYAILCIYFKFWCFEQNVWKDYVVWFRDNYTLCEFDERLYQYVVVGRRYIENENYMDLRNFDVWSKRFDHVSNVSSYELTATSTNGDLNSWSDADFKGASPLDQLGSNFVTPSESESWSGGSFIPKPFEPNSSSGFFD